MPLGHLQTAQARRRFYSGHRVKVRWADNRLPHLQMLDDVAVQMVMLAPVAVSQQVFLNRKPVDDWSLMRHDSPSTYLCWGLKRRPVKYISSPMIKPLSENEL